MSLQPASAAQAVGEYLQSPDDLMKVAAFRKKLEKEKRRWLWAMLKAYDQIECKLARVDGPDHV